MAEPVKSEIVSRQEEDVELVSDTDTEDECMDKKTAEKPWNPWSFRVKRKTYSVNVKGIEVHYRLCSTTILFQAESVLPLLQKTFPLHVDICDKSALENLVCNKSQKRRSLSDQICTKKLSSASKNTALAQVVGRDYFSWKTLNLLINGPIFDQSLRDFLNSYKPFEDIVLDVDKMKPWKQTLEQDCVKLAGVNVPFLISNGKIFFDLLASFTILGQLRLPLKNDWEKIDQILLERGFVQKDAFRWRHSTKPRKGERKSPSHESHITFKAVKVLAESELVEDEARRKVILPMFQHLEEEISKIYKVRKDLIEVMQTTFSTCQIDGQYFRKGKPLGRKRSLATRTEKGKTSELCHNGCGRHYHLSNRCCEKVHSMKVGDRSDVRYVVKNEQIFLEKCGAFLALGRLYVVRCSDYRKCDRLLNSVNMKPSVHYLYENQAAPKKKAEDKLTKRRNRLGVRGFRRTHISLEAFISLFHLGFKEESKSAELGKTIADITSDVDQLKADCLSYVPSKEGSPEVYEPLKKVPKEDLSSSGVETESCDSSDTSYSSTGDKEPKMEEDIDHEEPPKVLDCRLVGRKIPYIIKFQSAFLDLNSVSTFFRRKEGVSVPVMLRRRAKCLDFATPFYPPRFDKRVSNYINLECFVTLIEREYVSPAGGTKNQLLDDLKVLNIEVRNVASSSEEIADQRATKSTHCVETKSKPSETFTVTLNGKEVSAQLRNQMVYLDKTAVFDLFSGQKATGHRIYRSTDKVLEQAKISLDEAFIFEGRKRRFISTQALRVLVEQKFLKFDGEEVKVEEGNEGEEERIKTFLDTLSQLNSDHSKLKLKNVLKMPSFNKIQFKLHNSTLFLHTLSFMQAVGFSQKYTTLSSSKVFCALVNMLKSRGLNVNACFLRNKKAKYGFISVYACMLLFKTEFGAFKDKKRVGRLRRELMAALSDQGLLDNCDITFKDLTTPKKPSETETVLTIGQDFPSFKYKIKDGFVFIHRKTCFEAVGIEQAIMANSRGFGAVNSILESYNIDLEKCYLKGKQEQFAYISLEAMLVLLESSDPLLICLARKQDFLDALLEELQRGAHKVLQSQFVIHSLTGEDNQLTYQFPLSSDQLKVKGIACKFENGKFYLKRKLSYLMSGITEKRLMDEKRPENEAKVIQDIGLSPEANFVGEGSDPHAYISLSALLSLTSLHDGKNASYRELMWTDLLSALLKETPKLKFQVKMREFRNSIVETLCASYHRFLEQSCNSTQPDLLSEQLFNSGIKFEDMDPGDTAYLQELMGSLSSVPATKEDEEEVIEVLSEDQPASADELDASSAAECDDMDYDLISLKEFQKIKEEIVAIIEKSQTKFIGDWEVMKCDDSEIKLTVSPGIGSSRKISYIQPDVCAMLKYEFILKNTGFMQLLISDRPSPTVHFFPVFKKSSGAYNLLYNLLTLRPCFGNFNQELVETVEQNSSSILDGYSIVDKNFIGSSQSGRTFAGTVRSVDCEVISESKIADTCGPCSELYNVVINRSLLPAPIREEPKISAVPSSLATKVVKKDSPTLGSALDMRRTECLQLINPKTRRRLSSMSSDDGQHSKEKNKQESVWKVEETSVEGCTFLCPQLQSFNTSLPHHFVDKSTQATSVIEHRVVIASDLSTKVSLNRNLVRHKTYPSFEKNKQVGPLLDWVASLRYCVGYSDPILVEHARYLLKKMSLLPGQIQKILGMIAIDEEFKYRVKMSEAKTVTLRAHSCHFVAGDHTNVCDQCKLLQEPLEFLGL